METKPYKETVLMDGEIIILKSEYAKLKEIEKMYEDIQK